MIQDTLPIIQATELLSLYNSNTGNVIIADVNHGKDAGLNYEKNRLDGIFK